MRRLFSTSLLSTFLCCMPLLMHAQPVAKKTASKPMSVRLKTADGWTLSARYTRSGKDIAVVFLHGLAAGKNEWLPLEEALAKRGVSCLAVDLRGHEGALWQGGKREWRSFSDHGPDSEWQRMRHDAEAGWRFLTDKGYKRVGLAGASVGANVVLAAAAKNPQVRFAALLSPGMDYQGVRSSETAMSYGPRPLLLAASPPDAYAFQSCEILRRIRFAGRLPVDWIEARSGHGAQMFQEPDILESIAAWITANSSPKP